MMSWPKFVQVHMAELYHIIAAETYHKAFLKLEAPTQPICKFISTDPSRSDVPTANVIGLARLGQHYSTCVDDWCQADAVER